MTDNPNPQEDTKKKRKRDARDVEWSFDFAKLGDSVRKVLGSMAGEAQVQEGEFIAARSNAESADIQVQFSVGEATLSALESGGDNLLEADVKYLGEMEFTSEGETHKIVRLKQKTDKLSAKPLQQGLRALADKEELYWDVKISPDVPVALELDGGVGKSNVDLTGIQLTALDIETGVGSLNLTLPVQDTEYEVSVDGGVGQTRITVPQGAAVVLDVEGGVGSVDVVVPPQSPVKLQAKGGLGSVNVPSRIIRKSEKKDFMNNDGIWQSDSYELTTDDRITIYYDGGVGQFTIRDAEII